MRGDKERLVTLALAIALLPTSASLRLARNPRTSKKEKERKGKDGQEENSRETKVDREEMNGGDEEEALCQRAEETTKRRNKQ